MTTNYFSQALFQEMLYFHNLKEVEKLTEEINDLKAKIFNRQKKHRRCDKDISKIFNCPHCQKLYASDVALKLHLKLKHANEKQQQEKSTSQSPFDCSVSQEAI